MSLCDRGWLARRKIVVGDHRALTPPHVEIAWVVLYPLIARSLFRLLIAFVALSAPSSITWMPPKKQKKQPKRKVKRVPTNARRSAQSPVSHNARSYLASLLFPDVVVAKVCDSCTIPSNNVRVTHDITGTIPESGAYGLCLSVWTRAFYQEATIPANTTFTWGITQWISWDSVAQQRFSRPVSASLSVVSLAGANDMGGEIVGWFSPGNSYSSGILPTSVSNALAGPYNVTLPIRQGMFIRWRPVDAGVDQYRPIPSTADASFGNIGFCVWGAKPGTAVRIHLAVNYETLPPNDLGMMPSASQVTESPFDPSGFARAREAIVNFPFAETADRIRRFATGLHAGMASIQAMNIASRLLLNQNRQLRLMP